MSLDKKMALLLPWQHYKILDALSSNNILACLKYVRAMHTGIHISQTFHSVSLAATSSKMYWNHALILIILYNYIRAFTLEWPVPSIEVKSLEQSIRCDKERRYLEESKYMKRRVRGLFLPFYINSDLINLQILSLLIKVYLVSWWSSAFCKIMQSFFHSTLYQYIVKSWLNYQ